ncbi:hypothetical protein BJ138DRAFT_1104737 [Hygrophoropsis aurantiaca]|uniref:Uncharacterized protein n=1 Tax=Hygrophoropsis aurantiaca TaxID=72124 RepID=A0ACB8A072_9AGAM|nr:hypothetical protein BJ138DRAFT_1104737 [Hygrophoropsis aurantiaca]
MFTFNLFTLLLMVLATHVHLALTRPNVNYSIELYSGPNLTGSKEHHHSALTHAKFTVDPLTPTHCSVCMATNTTIIPGKLGSFNYVTQGHAKTWKEWGPLEVKAMPKDVQNAKSHKACVIHHIQLRPCWTGICED